MKLENDFQYNRSKQIVEEIKAEIEQLEKELEKDPLRAQLFIACSSLMKQEIEEQITEYESVHKKSTSLPSE